MVLPRWLARANKTITNRFLGRIPRRWSPFAIVHHVGRNSGCHYSVPIAAFRTERGFLLTPTYGPQADWVRNVLTAASFHLDRKGEIYSLSSARLVGREEAWTYLPRPIRLAMRLLGVHSFLRADYSR